MIYAYTSFTYSYLNRARVLASSLKRIHPEWTVCAVITDEPPPGFEWDPSQEGFDLVLNVKDLYLGGLDGWLFKMDVVEACTAVKGEALVHLLALQDAEAVMYFDPDTALFNSMDPVVQMLQSFDIILTPHQIDPDPREDQVAIIDNEICSLQHGIYNLGFVAVSSKGEGPRFARWWADRLNDWCYDRKDIGVFVDQKWCDLVPGFFDNVKVLRDPGYNVASWNLSQRTLNFDALGNILVNGRLLRFFHFTKLGPVGDTMTRRYAGENTEVYELWSWYKREIELFSTDAIPTGWWWYGTFDNGVRIPKAVREMYRNRGDLQKAFGNPIKLESGFFDWIKANTNLML